MEPPGAFTAREKKVKREKKSQLRPWGATRGARRSDVDDVADLHATFFFFARTIPFLFCCYYPFCS
jgi:hypothetical protein